MPQIKTTSLITLFIFLLLGLSSVYTIKQGNNGLLLRLGKLKTISDNKIDVLEPGLHFKFPFVEQARIFDTRLQTLDINSSRVVTKQKKDVIVDYYVKWKIADLAKYYKATSGNQYQAETLLEQKLNTALRAEFGKRSIVDVVSGERRDIMQLLNKSATTSAIPLGIKVVDVRIKGIDLPANASLSVYNRMRANMKKIANKHRADGKAEAESIQAGADAEVTVILAKAHKSAKKIKAKGIGQAAKIYNLSYSKDPEFFAFYRSLLAYQNTFKSKQDILVLQPKGQFFEYFSKANNKS